MYLLIQVFLVREKVRFGTRESRLYTGQFIHRILEEVVSQVNLVRPFFVQHVFFLSMLIKRSNLTQQYADIYLLQSNSTCFGRHSTHHQEH